MSGSFDTTSLLFYHAYSKQVLWEPFSKLFGKVLVKKSGWVTAAYGTVRYLLLLSSLNALLLNISNLAKVLFGFNHISCLHLVSIEQIYSEDLWLTYFQFDLIYLFLFN